MMVMPNRYLFDTDVLIDYLRGREQALTFVESLSECPTISVITVGELYSGVREGQERTILDQFITGLEIVPVDREMAIRGGLFRRDFLKSHKVEMADVLIAATSVVMGIPLVTLNRKHFPMLPDLIVPYQKP
jgi:predicted nucleic acid-binding protein